MEKWNLKGIMAVVLGAVVSLAFAAQVSAMAPNLSFTSNGNGTVGITVYADTNASVVLDYYSGGQLMGAGIIGYTNSTGYFTGTIYTSSYTIPSGAQVVVMVNGQQSLPAIWPTNTGYNQYPNNGYGTTPVLSQTNVNLVAGQSQTVTITNGYAYYSGYSTSQYSINNPATNIVSASVNGNVITLNGQNAGTGAISICANGTNGYYSSNCANLYVTVTGSLYNNNTSYYYPPTYPTDPYPYYPPTNYYNNSPLTVSNSNVQVTVGNSGSVVIYGNNNNGYNNGTYPYNVNGSYPYNNGTYYNQGSNFYVSNNSNGIANATVSGNTLTVYGQNAGSTNVTVCDSTSNQCATINVTVIAPNYYNNNNGNYSPSQNGQWYWSNTNHCWTHR